MTTPRYEPTIRQVRRMATLRTMVLVMILLMAMLTKPGRIRITGTMIRRSAMEKESNTDR